MWCTTVFHQQLNHMSISISIYLCMCTQSCPTLCSLVDCSWPGSSVHGIFQEWILGGMPFPPSGNLPDPGIKPASSVPCALTGRFYTTEPSGKTYLSIPSISIALPILMMFIQPHSVINPSRYIYHDGCCSVFLSCSLTLCNPMDCSKPGFSVHHHLLELDDAIQPSDPLSSPFPPLFNLYQHHGLFQWVGTSCQVANVLELQHQSFQWIFRIHFLWDRLGWSPATQGTLKSLLQHHSSKVSIIWHSAFFMSSQLLLNSAFLSTLTSIHDYCKNNSFDLRDLCWQNNVYAF